MKLKIGFAKPKAWFVPLSWMIRWVEKTPFSHTYFQFADQMAVFSTTPNEPTVFESNISDGTIVHSKETFVSNYQIVEEYEFNLTKDQAQFFYHFCEKYKTKPYGLIELFGILLADIFHMDHNPLSRGLESRMVCTKMLFLYMQQQAAVFYPLGHQDFNKNADTVGMKEVYELIRHSPLGIKVA